MRKLPEVLATRCMLKSTEICSRKRIINEFSIWRVQCIRTYDALIINNKINKQNFVLKLI